MTLAEYLKSTGTTQEAFAREMGVGQATVSRWCSGGFPRPRQLATIEKVTAGQVRAADFFATPGEAA